MKRSHRTERENLYAFEFLWNDADYGKCPNKPCLNGGRCGMSGSNEYFCSCNSARDFVGEFCEARKIDLTPLVIVPIVVGILIVLLIILWVIWICMGLCRPAPAPVSFVWLFSEPVARVCSYVGLLATTSSSYLYFYHLKKEPQKCLGPLIVCSGQPGPVPQWKR